MSTNHLVERKEILKKRIDEVDTRINNGEKGNFLTAVENHAYMHSPILIISLVIFLLILVIVLTFFTGSSSKKSFGLVSAQVAPTMSTASPGLMLSVAPSPSYNDISLPVAVNFEASKAPYKQRFAETGKSEDSSIKYQKLRAVNPGDVKKHNYTPTNVTAVFRDVAKTLETKVNLNKFIKNDSASKHYTPT